MTQSIVRSSVVSGLNAFIRDLGFDPARTVPAYLQEIAAGTVPTFSLADYMELLNICAETTLTPNFGLRFGARYRRRDLGLIAYLFTYNHRLADSMTGFQTYFSTLQTHSHYAHYTAGDMAVVEYLAPGPDPLFKAQDAEFSMMVQLRCFQFSLGQNWTPTRMEFEHPCLSTPDIMSRALNCEIRFGCGMNRILFPKSQLFSENPQADPRIVALIQDALDAERAEAEKPVDFVEAVQRKVREHFRKERPVTADAIAGALGISVSQLDYRLRALSLSFRRELNAIRQAEAESLLTNSDLAIGEIASRLGYSEVSAFSRWFKSRTGGSATRYRQDRRVPRPRE